jgi:hypothetical protein
MGVKIRQTEVETVVDALYVCDVLRLCGAEPPTVADLLASVTAEPRLPRAFYTTIVGDRIELDVLRSPKPMAPEGALKMLRPATEVSKATLAVGDQTLQGVRSLESVPRAKSKHEPIHEAFVAQSDGGWLGAVITYDQATDAQAQALLKDTLSLLL